MTYFLTSSPFLPASPDLNPANGFLQALHQALPGPVSALFVCSAPRAFAFTDRIAKDMQAALCSAGFSLSAFRVLDGRNGREAGALIQQSGLIVLAGGHVPTQNAFFHEAGLPGLMAAWQGVVLGISAGTMNCARTVYAQPEEPGEALSPTYRRFLSGLGITDTMILPHYQQVRENRVDGLRLFEDITYPDSRGRTFYALPDGSYLLGKDGREWIRGQSWMIQDGQCRALTREGEEYLLPR